jgi:hypothetical protein
MIEVWLNFSLLVVDVLQKLKVVLDWSSPVNCRKGLVPHERRTLRNYQH